MAQVQNQLQLLPGQAAAAPPPPGGGGGGGGGGGDDGDHNGQAPGRAHYVDEEMLTLWRAIYNKKAGSAGTRDKHGRCIRCGRTVGEHHRKNWMLQKCKCVLCDDTLEHGHHGAICPRMAENREVFTRTWVRESLDGYVGRSKGNFPPPISAAEFRARRNAMFRPEVLDNGQQQQQQQQVAPLAPVQQVAAPQQPLPMAGWDVNGMLGPMLMGMTMGMGMLMASATNQGANFPLTLPMPFAPAAMAAPAAIQQQQAGMVRGRGGRGARSRGRGGRNGAAARARPDAAADAARARAGNLAQAPAAEGDGDEQENPDVEMGGDGAPQNQANNNRRDGGRDGGGPGTGAGTLMPIR